MLAQFTNTPRPLTQNGFENRVRMSSRLRQKETRFYFWRHALCDLKPNIPNHVMENAHMLRNYLRELNEVVGTRVRKQLEDLKLFGQFLNSWV